MCDVPPKEFLITENDEYSDYVSQNKVKRFYVKGIQANLHDIDILFRVNNPHLIRGYLLGTQECRGKTTGELLIREQALPIYSSGIHRLTLPLPLSPLGQGEISISEDVYSLIFLKLIDQITRAVSCLTRANYYLPYLSEDCIGYVINESLLNNFVLDDINAIDFYITNFDNVYYIDTKYPAIQVTPQGNILSPTSYYPSLVSLIINWYYGPGTSKQYYGPSSDLSIEELHDFIARRESESDLMLVLNSLLHGRGVKLSKEINKCYIHGYKTLPERLNIRNVRTLLNSVYLTVGTLFEQIPLRTLCLIVSWSFYFHLTREIYEKNIITICRLAQMWYSEQGEGEGDVVDLRKGQEQGEDKDILNMVMALSSVLGQNDLYLKAPSALDCIRVLNSNSEDFVYQHYITHFEYPRHEDTPVFVNDKNNYVSFYVDGGNVKVRLV